MFAKGTKARRNILIHSSVAATFLLAILHIFDWKRSNPLNDPEIARAVSTNFSTPPTPELLVPNYVHFIFLNSANISFTHFLCILAAMKNQRPEAIFFHTNNDLSGVYWDQLSEIPEFRRIAQIKLVQIPEAILDQPLTESVQIFYGVGILKILVLRAYGGIYLDTNTYIVKDLKGFRGAELTLDSGTGMSLGSQICLAHKDARFLKVWAKLYRRLYESNGWYYFRKNQVDRILGQHPELVQRLPEIGELHFYDRNSSRFKESAPYWKSFHVFQLPRDLQYYNAKDSHSFDFHVTEDDSDDATPLIEMIEEVSVYARQNSDVG